MTRTLDMSAVWAATMAMLKRHREAIVPIAGLLILVPGWASKMLVPEPDIEGLKSLDRIFDAIIQNFNAHWFIIIPLSLISVYGGLAILTLLLRPDARKIGDVLKLSLLLFPLYFAVNWLGTLLSIAGVFAFFIGMLYISGRLMPAGASAVADSKRGVFGSLRQGWRLTQGNGWKAILLLCVVILIGLIIGSLVDVVIGTICTLIAGPDGIGLIQHFFSALTDTAMAVIIVALEAALYLHLQQQD